jgi:hypothetical protein
VSDLRVELLYTLDCPHWEHVRADLHRVLSEGTIETPIQLVLVGGEDDAEFLDFVGSPSVRLNGVDVAPPPPGTRHNTGCRLYVQANGSLSGRIPESLLREAILSHRRGRLEEFQRQESRKVAAAALEAAEDERAGAGGDAANRADAANDEEETQA